MGYSSIHSGPRDSAGKGCFGHQYLDQVPCDRYSRKHVDLAGFRRSVRDSGTKAWILNGIRWRYSQVVPKSNLLAPNAGLADTLLVERFRMEIVRFPVTKQQRTTSTNT